VESLLVQVVEEISPEEVESSLVRVEDEISPEEVESSPVRVVEEISPGEVESSLAQAVEEISPGVVESGPELVVGMRPLVLPVEGIPLLALEVAILPLAPVVHSGAQESMGDDLTQEVAEHQHNLPAAVGAVLDQRLATLVPVQEPALVQALKVAVAAVRAAGAHL
jgi:hypothetical protein